MPISAHGERYVLRDLGIPHFMAGCANITLPDVPETGVFGAGVSAVG